MGELYIQGLFVFFCQNTNFSTFFFFFGSISLGKGFPHLHGLAGQDGSGAPIVHRTLILSGGGWGIWSCLQISCKYPDLIWGQGASPRPYSLDPEIPATLRRLALSFAVFLRSSMFTSIPMWCQTKHMGTMFVSEAGRQCCTCFN